MPVRRRFGGAQCLGTEPKLLKFLLEQIAEYDQLLREHAGAKGENRNLIKTIEKQKAARVERLKDLLAEDKKDDGLVFDELGVDHLFIDEFQYFKNLETPTKMDRVAGIQSGGSERAASVFSVAGSRGRARQGKGEDAPLVHKPAPQLQPRVAEH